MEITKTGEQVQKEADTRNRFAYRRMKAYAQGYVCPECGKTHFKPQIIEHQDCDDHFFHFRCVSCGCEWKSNVYHADWSRVDRLIAEKLGDGKYIPPSGWITLWITKAQLKHRFKKEMKALEVGYDPSVNYIDAEERIVCYED